jgi:hypothetical protein
LRIERVSEVVPRGLPEIAQAFLNEADRTEASDADLQDVPLSEAASAASPPKDEGEERAAQAALERTLIERSGMLLSPGTLEIEPSLTYAHASADNVSINGVSITQALVIGKIISDRTRRNILTPALTFRLGLPGLQPVDRWQRRQWPVPD